MIREGKIDKGGVNDPVPSTPGPQRPQGSSVPQANRYSGKDWMRTVADELNTKILEFSTGVLLDGKLLSVRYSSDGTFDVYLDDEPQHKPELADRILDFELSREQ